MNNKKKILLVEDDVALANVYRSRLDIEGFETEWVSNGEDALAARNARNMTNGGTRRFVPFRRGDSNEFGVGVGGIIGCKSAMKKFTLPEASILLPLLYRFCWGIAESAY